MKSNLDRLMQERNLDAFMVLGDSGRKHHTQLSYRRTSTLSMPWLSK